MFTITISTRSVILKCLKLFPIIYFLIKIAKNNYLYLEFDT